MLWNDICASNEASVSLENFNVVNIESSVILKLICEKMAHSTASHSELQIIIIVIIIIIVMMWVKERN